jgi:uncharacterized Tic20 family protein
MSSAADVSPVPSGAPSNEDKNMAIVIWILGLFIGIWMSLIFYLLKKSEGGWITDVVREALNFQISFLIYFAVSIVLIFVVIGVIIAPVVGILFIVFSIMGAVKCSSGQVYRCPLAIRMLK